MMPASIGPYQVVRLLGEGGMGAVYEVRDPELPRPLALKVIKGTADAGALARFGREAELLARVRHPAVLGVHTLGRTGEGDPYLVTDLVEGIDLARWRRTAHPSWTCCAELIRDLAVGLAALHAEGVIHRDLKPENVLVRPDGSPVILDFGVARGTGLESLTQTGVLVGTVAYMSPEQADGIKGIDPRTDVYSLGAVLYFLLTGAAPYAGQLAHVLTALMRPGPSLDPRKVDSAIPPRLSALCRRAMERDRERRTPDATTLRAELEAWLAGGDASPASATRRALFWLGAPALALVGAALALTFAGAGAGAARVEDAPLDSSPSAAASATPTLSPSTPSPSAPDPLSPQDAAGRELLELEQLWANHRAGASQRDLSQLNPRLSAWLEANPEHALAPRAAALARHTRRALPLAVLSIEDEGLKVSPWSSLHYVRNSSGLQLLACTWQSRSLWRWKIADWSPLRTTSLAANGGELLSHPRACLLLQPDASAEPSVILGGAFSRSVGPEGGRAGFLREVGLVSGQTRRQLALLPGRYSVRALARSPGGLVAVGTGYKVAPEAEPRADADPGSLLVLDPGGPSGAKVIASWVLGGPVDSVLFPADDLLVATRGDRQEGAEPGELVRRAGKDWAEETRLRTPYPLHALHAVDGSLLVGGRDGELFELSLTGTWTLPKPSRRSGPDVVAAPLNALARAGEVLFCGYGVGESRSPEGSREVAVWRRGSAGWSQVRRIPFESGVMSLGLSPGGELLAVLGVRTRLEVWDARAIAEPE